MPFTESEQRKLDTKRKKVRPSVFNAATGQETVISEDFETWLILTPPEARAAIAQSLQESLDEESVLQSNRDAVLAEFTENELVDAGRRLQEAENLVSLIPDLGGLSQIAAMQNNIPEVAAMVENMLLPAASVQRFEDAATNLFNWAETMKVVHNSKNTVVLSGSSYKRLEIESMIRALLAY